MKTSFLPKLVNGQTGDPALFVDILRQKRALLFDCGRIDSLSASELLRISDVFISHMHIDHFIGFDHLLRLHLGRGHRIRVFGPKGITSCVKGKLSGYTWNLVQHQRMLFEVHEFDGISCTISNFPCRKKFRPTKVSKKRVQNWLWSDELIRVKSTVLDHKIPCLAFKVEERDFYNVDPVRLKALGHKPGPWLNRLKEWVRSGSIAEKTIEVEGKRLEADELAKALLIHSHGKQIAYVADSGGSEENQRAIINLVRNADLFFCEGAFLDEDRKRASDTFHLTAGLAGRLAKEAGVKRLIPFHFSPKYDGRFSELESEAQQAFIQTNCHPAKTASTK